MKKQIIRESLKEITALGVYYILNTDNDLSDKFEDDVLIVAEHYREYLTVTTDNGSYICGMTLHNAKSRTFSKLNKPKILDVVNPCPRCDGTGKMPFRHIKAGVCFRCNGSGSSK